MATKTVAADDASRTARYVRVEGRVSTHAVGAFIELRETQMVLIVLILLDVVGATAGLVLDLATQLDPDAVPPLVGHLLQSFGGFTSFVFVIELTALVWVFQLAFFTHVGYCIDFGVVVAAVSWELQRESKVLRLLGLVRLWRIVRLVDTLLNDERTLHDATAALLEAEKQLTEKHAMTIHVLEDALEKEYAAKGQLNRVLQEYKDEVDTLKEALTIAAMSVMTNDDDDDDDQVDRAKHFHRGSSGGGDAIRPADSPADEFVDARQQ
ncbi:Aste57867_15496 [Aphanomyces stellatus]|uniref:Aste57867_15496 protein n=1 Tax=Aphanomyces stellatus TaxID=120398 RepID=A0A485L395_9STRA|nr:hypothetical protein As57867_015440 [Aphanomyces stellatus]VFT92298.1 Aste57867_15496 [Aphanomyces stellatus]